MSKVDSTKTPSATTAKPADAAEKQKAEARKIIDEAMKKSVSSWSSDDFVRDKVTPEVLQYAKPEEKAHMLKQLMDGSTGKGDEKAMLKVLKSVGSPDEMKEVMSKAGGAGKVLGELESQRTAFMDHVKAKGDDGSKMILDMARSYSVKDSQSDDFVAKHVDAKVLKYASNDDKAHMLKQLMHGPTGRRDENAMLRILKSSTNPKDILSTIDKAGGADKVLGELGDKNTGELAKHAKSMGAPGNRLLVDLAVKQKVESKYSDDFVRKYVDKDVLKQASPDEKTTMLKQLLNGPTGKGDETAIVRILDSAKDTKELGQLINGAGKDKLARDVDDAKLLKVVESKIFQVEASEAPSFTKLDKAKTDEATVDKKLGDLEKQLEGRKNRYDHLATGWPDKSGRFTKFYGDLSKITKEDLGQLKGWDKLSKDDKVDLYNRIAHEAHVELKHNVNLTYGKSGGKHWSEKEMTDIDNGLGKLPPALGLENEKLFNIRRFKDIIDDDGSKVAAWAKGNGDIEFSDMGVGGPYRLTHKGVPPVAETILHEVGHHFDDENPKWKEWNKLSGWNDLGGAKDSSLSKFEDGKTYSGKDLGLDDESGQYVVSRRYGRTYVYDKNANFMGNYAKSNPKDDFSESMMQYFYNSADFKTNAPDKWKFMDEWVKSQK